LWTKNPQTGNMVERHLWAKDPHKLFLKNSKSIFLPSKTIQQNFFWLKISVDFLSTNDAP